MKKKMRITFNSPLVLGYALACAVVTLSGALTGEKSTALLQPPSGKAEFQDHTAPPTGVPVFGNV